MSRENVDRLRDWYDRYWSKGDFFGSVEAWDPDAEIHMSTDYLEPTSGRGLEAVATLMGNWLRAWDEYRVFPERYIELDEERVLVIQRSEGRGKGSGVQVVNNEGCLYRIRNGKIVCLQFFHDARNALEAVGLRE